MKEKDNFWDTYGRSRDIWFLRTFHLHHRLSEKKIIPILKGMERSIQVMDIGCGDGYYLNLFSRMGFHHVQGIDPSRPLVESCWKRGLPAQQKSLWELREDVTFDLILMMQVLEHLEDPAAALRKVNALLRPGGRLLLTVPACDSFLKRYHRFRYGVAKLAQVKNWDETHLHAFSDKMLRSLLAATSFRVMRCLHASNPFPWAGRYGGEKIGEFFQRLDLGGIFGDVLIILASTVGEK